MIVSALVIALCACSTSKKFRSTTDETQTLSPRVIRVGDPVPKGGGVYKLGEPYLAAGRWYTPVHDTTYDRVGHASWYGDFFHGRKTANGEVYDMNRLSAAHPTFPMPAYAKVTNLTNNRSIIVRVNDRGPYAKDRIIDLSRKAAEMLGFYNRGTAAVRVQYYGMAPLDGDDSLERRSAANLQWTTRVEAPAPYAKPVAPPVVSASAISPVMAPGKSPRLSSQEPVTFASNWAPTTTWGGSALMVKP